MSPPHFFRLGEKIQRVKYLAKYMTKQGFEPILSPLNLYVIILCEVPKLERWGMFMGYITII